MSDTKKGEATKSVAPFPEGRHECPGCHQQTAYFDRSRNANVCSRMNCDYYERISDDYKCRQWSEAEIRALIREETGNPDRGAFKGVLRRTDAAARPAIQEFDRARAETQAHAREIRLDASEEGEL